MKAESVDINECGELEIKLHIRGLRLWRFRMSIVTLLIKLICWIAPTNVNCTLCDECLNEGVDNDE